MKKEKGFTIMELLGVLAIIAILALIIVPGVTKYIQKGKDTYNDGVKKQLVLAAKNRYSESNVSEIKNNVYDYVTAGELSTEGYLKEELVDSEGQSCTKDSYVVTKYTKTLTESGIKELKYYPCMKCGETTYMTEKEAKQCHKYKVIPYEISIKEGYPVCDIDRTYNRAIQTKLTITKNKVNEKNIVVEKITDDSFTEELETKLTEEEQGKSTITDKVHKFPWGNDKFKVYLIDTNDKYLIECGDPVPSKVPGEIKAKMYYVATDKFVNENSKPAKEDIDEYDGSWQDGYIYVEIENFDEYDYMTLGSSDERITTSWFWITKEGAVTTKVVGHYDALSSDKTKVESRTQEKELNTKLDRTDPVVTLANPKNGVWTNANVTVTANANGTYSPVKKIEYSYDNSSWSSYGTCNEETCNIGKTWTSNINQTVYVKVTDSVGRSATKNTELQIDKTAPTITVNVITKKQSDGWYKSPFEVKVSCSDSGGSGLSSFTVNGTARSASGYTHTIKSAGKSQKVNLVCKDNAGNSSSQAPTYNVKVYSAVSSCPCKSSKKTCSTCYSYNWYCAREYEIGGGAKNGTCKKSQVGSTKVSDKLSSYPRICTCKKTSYSCNCTTKCIERSKCWHY